MYARHFYFPLPFNLPKERPVHYAIHVKCWQCISLILTSLVTQYIHGRNLHTWRQVEHLVLGGLRDTYRHGKIFNATAKSVAGRGNPELNSAPTHALAWFFVGTRSPLLGALLAYLVGGVCCVMVARAGQLSGWPVSSGFAGISTPARATAMSVETLVGSEYLSNSEAAIMATIPTLATSKLFTFLLAAHGCRVAELPRIRTVSTTAHTEAEARAHLPGLPLVFLSRTPSNKGVAA
ncbi:ash family protein [Aeromonas simiae]|uniref:ash family protein n=1 Tax=Aeromonas simiae TaxID=218936 RepID=UPI001D00DDE3|nr:ash family protein [Aeromonas simiae]